MLFRVSFLSSAIAAAAISSGCEEPAVEQPSRPDVSDALGEAPDVGELYASEVLLAAEVAGLAGPSVQVALESLAADVLGIHAIVAALQTPPAVTVVAAEVKFVPNGTRFVATTVQDFGVEVGQDLTNLELASDALKTQVQEQISTSESISAKVDSFILDQVEVDAQQDYLHDALFNWVDEKLKFASGIHLETPTTDSTDHIFANEPTLGADLSVHDAISFLWIRVGLIQDHHQTPCPPDMELRNGVLCVDRNRGIGTLSWMDSAMICSQFGKRLCTPGELVTACNLNAFAPEDQSPGGGIAVKEWTDTIGSDGLAIHATGPTCTDFGGDSPTASHIAYPRCCKHAIPPLPKE